MNSSSLYTEAGLAVNNPGHLRPISGRLYRGQCGITEGGLCIFRSAVYGLRAIAITWMDYCYFRGADSMSQYVWRWVGDRIVPYDTWITSLCTAAGVSPTAPYNPCDRPESVLKAIVQLECGQCPYSPQQLQRAIQLAHIR